ncbi:MAG: GNAT family N-acetyltransferase [Proteobacteria bacterium]|nr:GNAT family N-acetyltransferase [Pseudomonadota bacterium]
MFQALLALVAREKQRQSRASPGVMLVGERVMLRAPRVEDWQDWVRLRSLSAPFLQPWEPDWPKNALTRDYYMSYWRRLVRRWVQDREYAFVICSKPHENALLGGITVTDIKREATQSGTLGYWIGAPYAGRGFMKDAAAMIAEFAFRELKLHRLEATCMPENKPSIKLLRAIGMQEIGLAKRYMKINSQWQDHVLFEKVSQEAVTAPESF